jgi:predicted XRE-type DNA-binding protein
MSTKMQSGSRNVYRDLGFPVEEAENLKGRSDLMIRLTKIIENRGLTQLEAARLLGVTQPRISDLMRGKIDRFSIDSLVEMLGRVGIGVRFVLRPRKKVA